MNRTQLENMIKRDDKMLTDLSMIEVSGANYKTANILRDKLRNFLSTFVNQHSKGPVKSSRHTAHADRHDTHAKQASSHRYYPTRTPSGAKAHRK